MATLPTVAIIGRPNTGKSTLFNRLVGRRKAIVSETAGTTRDHVAASVKGDDLDYLLVDTGGMGGGTEDNDLEDDVHRQSLLALENADVIVFTLNSREGLTRNDFEIADLLRKNKKKHVPIVIALTKCDDPTETDQLLPQYYELGFNEDIIPISAPHKMGIDDLTTAIEEKLKELNFKREKAEVAERPVIALIGRPNVGKSSIVNALLSDTSREKSGVLVSDIPGTTRDTTDHIVRYQENEYVFLDTAGIKQRKNTSVDIETHAYFRSIRALEMADVVVLVVDISQRISKQDKRIASMAVEEGKGLILMLNKVDTLSTEEKEKAIMHIKQELAFCRFACFLPCSAETREGLLKLFPQVDIVQRNRTRRLATKALNQWFTDAVYGQPMGQLSRSKHITQADEIPPTFVVFVKDPKKVQVSQLRYLDNRIRETFDFAGVPIRWITKAG